MLSDDAFTTSFLKESAKRLSERRRAFTVGLARVGIRCLEGNAGLFCWMDLSPMLKEPTAHEELTLWRVIVNEVKLNVSPGTSFHCAEPGWFRVCFANIDDETMEVALRRIREFVGRANLAEAQPKKKSWQGPRLRLSLSKRFEDLSVMSPHHLLSPHSPLVKAAN
ncbi:uncharacterized protein A4U43_C10F2530 [Asparagus officinalis]|uniref:1-aminocyclopropane-1-carboxylate synthase n=1 Tax=Asparagus officinalis TaxID=4686 RepID=A0A5P1E068_ASPOF|nr:uncharacterized protein A4U43_C10F2530 [Asparagus officinalis]